MTTTPSHRVILVPWLKPLLSLLVADWQAITLGHLIIAAEAPSEAVLAHELVHVQQWDRYGWTFPFRYLAASLVAWRAGGHWYRANRYEIEARG